MFDINSIDWMGVPGPKPGETEHLNCCQRTLMAHCDILGVSEEEAKYIGKYFGGGMRARGTCGPVNAVLMLLGALYKNDPEKKDAGKEFLIAFAEANGSWLCSDIRDEEHIKCNAAVDFGIDYVAKMRKEMGR